MEKKVLRSLVIFAIVFVLVAGCVAVSPAPVPKEEARMPATQDVQARTPAPTSASVEEVIMLKPTTLRQGDQWPTRGGQRFLLITGPASWAKFLRQQRGQPDAWPAIDWERDVVLVALMGGKRTGGYRITIEKVQVQGNVVNVYVKEETPQPGEMVIQVLTSPYHVVTVPRAALPAGDFTLRFITPSGVWEQEIAGGAEDTVFEAQRAGSRSPSSPGGIQDEEES